MPRESKKYASSDCACNRFVPLQNPRHDTQLQLNPAIDTESFADTGAVRQTDMGKAEEQLRLLAAAVEHAEDSILITSTEMTFPGPEIVFVNRAFTKMTGYTAQEVLGQSPRILQ